MSLIHQIEARILALGGSNIELRLTGPGGSSLLATYTLGGERQAHVWPIPNLNNRKPRKA